MPELRIVPAPSRDAQRRALRDTLAELVAGWRPLAEDLLGAEDRIEWLGRDEHGRTTLVLLGDGEDDLSLVARGLAQREWAAARLRDWSQLAPNAGLRPEAGVRLVLVAPAFRPAALAAARVLPPSDIVCAVLRFAGDGVHTVALLERVVLHPDGPVASEPAPPKASFRSGLSDADLDLTPEERAELDGTPEPSFS